MTTIRRAPRGDWPWQALADLTLVIGIDPKTHTYYELRALVQRKINRYHQVRTGPHVSCQRGKSGQLPEG